MVLFFIFWKFLSAVQSFGCGDSARLESNGLGFVLAWGVEFLIFLCLERKQSCPIATGAFHGGKDTNVCVGIWTTSTFLGQRTCFRGKEPISVGWRVSAVSSEVTIPQISRSARNLQVHWDSQEPLIAKPRLSSCAGPFIFPRWPECCHSCWGIMRNSLFNDTAAASTPALPGTAPVGVVWLDRLKVLLQLMLHHGSLSIRQEVSAVLFTSLCSPL